MRLAAIAIASLALGLAACGEKTVDTGNAEQTITDFVSDETGFEPKDTSCPEGVKAEVGETFECSFTGPEGPYVAFVEITEVDGEDAIFQIRTRPKR